MKRVTEDEEFRAEVLNNAAAALREFQLTEEESALVLEEAEMLAAEIQEEAVEEAESPEVARRPRA
jgi:hypothetical protein